MYVPKELGPLMGCNKTTLIRKFPPGETHQSQIYDELGQPFLTVTHHGSGTTTWRYRVQEYWVAHAPSLVPMHELRRHELVLTFNSQGVLQSIARNSH
jgi:outer membrane protein assembly factor BamE (lipoprotein component of BamABCDE complex)